MNDNQQPVAIIKVDGDDFIIVTDKESNVRALFEETVRRIGGEVALLVWKPRYGIYLREKLSITASV